MKKWIMMLLTALFALILVACNGDSNDDASDSSSDSSNTNNSSVASDSGKNNDADDEKVYKFKTTVQSPEAAALSQGFNALLDYIEEKAAGRIEFERYYGDALVKPADAADAVGAGIADIALLAPSYTPANNPLSTIESLPALWKDQWTGTRALLQLYEEFPELTEEFQSRNIAVLGAWALPTYHVISKTDVNSFEDIKGLKVIAAGGQALIADALGAVAVGVTMPESFEAMERGAVDGGFLGYTSSSTYGIHEIAESVWTIPIGSQGGVFGMNLDKYNELPDDLKAIFEEASIENAVAFHEIYQTNSDETVAYKKYEDAGVKINEATADDVKQLQKLAEETVWKNWVESPERSGKPAQQILDRFIELIEQFDKEYQQNGLPK